jgi:hypothetical protein
MKARRSSQNSSDLAVIRAMDRTGGMAPFPSHQPERKTPLPESHSGPRFLSLTAGITVVSKDVSDQEPTEGKARGGKIIQRAGSAFHATKWGQPIPRALPNRKCANNRANKSCQHRSVPKWVTLSGRPSRSPPRWTVRHLCSALLTPSVALSCGRVLRQTQQRQGRPLSRRAGRSTTILVGHRPPNAWVVCGRLPCQLQSISE